jgi:hypothetical protein
MEPLTIAIIICVILAIILAIYFITKRTPTEQSLLDKTLKAFNIGIESKNTEKFSTDIIFNTEADIKNNFMEFLRYLFPKMNIDTINTLLTQYESNKTMQEILTEKKDKIDLRIFPNEPMKYYKSYIFDETDDTKIIDNLYIYYLVLIAFHNIILYLNSKLIQDELPDAYKNIEYLKIVLTDDYKTSNILNSYIRSNFNKDVPLSDAIVPNSAGIPPICFTNILCKMSINLQDFINREKTNANKNMAILKQLFNLSIVKNLLTLNESNIDKINEDLATLFETLNKNSRAPNEFVQDKK